MAGRGPVILIVEDEPEIRRFLRVTLAAQGYRPIEAATASDGLRLASTQTPDLVLLDLGLPDLDGIEVTRRLREWTLLPIVVLSAREREGDKIAALDAGADDYLTKPFGVGELMARVRVALRHAGHSPTEPGELIFRLGDLQVDQERRQVLVADQPVHLTPIEYRLLTILVHHAGKVLTHRQLLKEAWGPAYADESNLLRVHMTRLRHKLEIDPARPRYVLTEPGVGYRLASD